MSEGTEYRGVVELRSDTVKGILYDADGNQLAATDQVTDTTHSGGHYGFYTGAGQPAYYDYVTKESLSKTSGTLFKSVDDFEDYETLSDYYAFIQGESGASLVTDQSQGTSTSSLGETYFGLWPSNKRDFNRNVQ